MTTQPSSHPAWPTWLGLGSAATLTLGLYAVGTGGLYAGDTWPDFLVIGAAALQGVIAFSGWAGRGLGGAWSWTTLRPRAWGFLGGATVVLFALSVIVPVETGVWPVGDSAHGFAVFTFVGALAVAATASARVRAERAQRPAPRRLSVADRWNPAVGGVEIPLSSPWWRRGGANLTIRGSHIELVAPGLFAGNESWRVEARVLAVLSQPQPDDPGDPVDEPDWVTLDDFVVPFVRCGARQVAPNLTFLFTERQTLPALSGRGRILVEGVRAAGPRSGALLVDGLDLRVADPDAAVDVLREFGVEVVSDAAAFVKRHRDITHDDEQVGQVRKRIRRSIALEIASAAVGLALLIGMWASDDDRYAFGLLALLTVDVAARWIPWPGRSSGSSKP